MISGCACTSRVMSVMGRRLRDTQSKKFAR
jgi:hypothetical protein